MFKLFFMYLDRMTDALELASTSLESMAANAQREYAIKLEQRFRPCPKCSKFSRSITWIYDWQEHCPGCGEENPHYQKRVES